MMKRFCLESPAIRYAVIGDPVDHSLSPIMQNAGFQALGLSARYGKLHVRPEELTDFVEFARNRLDGFNATVPHKAALLKLLDEVSPEARACGSVNTVTVRDHRLYGDTTDGYGLCSAMAETVDFQAEGSEIVLLGAGGAAHAAAWKLAQENAKKIYIVNRTLSRAQTMANELETQWERCKFEPISPEAQNFLQEIIPRVSLVLQATSSGLHENDVPPIPPESLKNARRFFEMIYRPTPLLQAARQFHVPCADGRTMLLHQGAKSFSIWTGQPAPVEAMRQALANQLN